MQINQEVSAIITGGASGLGAACASMLRENGVAVAIFDYNPAGELIAQKIAAKFCQVDITNEDAVASAFAEARQVNGQERILINCAGVLEAAKTVSRDKTTKQTKRFPMEKFQRAIEINLIATFRCITYSAEGMLELEALADGERGIIINTASVAAEDGQIGQAAYSASKGGIVAMTLPIARDLMNDGIRINTILPGIFETPMMAGMPDNVKETLGQSVPFPKRLGKPREFADLVEALIKNVYINGETIRLDGAIRLPPR